MSGSGRNSSRRPAARALLLSLLLALPAEAAPQIRLRSVGITGMRSPGERELLPLLESRPGITADSLRLEKDSRVLAARLRSEGYLECTVRPSLSIPEGDSTAGDLRFIVTEGPLTLVGQISLGGLMSVSGDGFAALMATRPGRPLNEEDLEEDISALLEELDRAGRPFAACSIASAARRVEEGAYLLDLLLGVDEGPLVRINEITVQGNTETRAEVVIRETRLRTGEPFDPDRIDAIRSRLRRLNIFANVEEPELYLRGGSGGLRIRVREGSTNTFDGVLGYLPPRAPGQGGTVTGLAAVTMRNLFGTGRRFAFRWQRDDNLSQELGVRYMEPWIFGIPLNVGGGFFQRKQDSAYVRRAVDLAAEYMVTENLSVGASILTESVIPSATVSSRVLRSSTLSLGADISFDSRDDPYSPTSGVRYRADYANGRKRFDPSPAGAGGGTSAIQRFGLDCDAYIGTFLRQVVVVGVHGREVRGGTVEDGEFYRLGGLRTLRGFRENQFLGSRIAWSTLEYRFLLGRRTFLSGFLDSGYIFRPRGEDPGDAGTDLVTFGYGTGLQVETALGIMAVSLALGRGDSFGEAKVHVGLISEF